MPFPGKKPEGIKMPFPGEKPEGIKMPFPGNKPEGIKMPFPGEKPEGIKMPFPGNKPEGIKMPFPGRKPEGFGETSVLSQERGVTTVLGSNSSPAACTEAFLVRKKNGQAMKIQKPLFRIGTEKTFVDFWIPDNTAVSHSHADILEENGSYYLRDNHSTNHTYVNGTMLPADQKKLLQDQDQIVLGNEAFVFEYRQEVV